VSQVRTTSRSWDKGVLTDLCLTRVLTDLCLTCIIKANQLRTLQLGYLKYFTVSPTRCGVAGLL